MPGPAVFFKGVRLWEIAQGLAAPANRTGAGGHTGITQSYAKENPQSPNFMRDVKVKAVVEEMAAYSDLSPASSMILALMHTERRLIAVSKTLGEVAWADDPDRRANVTGGPYEGDDQAVAHDVPAGSWTPTAGRKVLCCNRATGEGFVADIESVPGGTAVVIDVPAEYSVTSAWDLIDVQIAVGKCEYRSMIYGTRTPYDGGEWRPDVEYAFASFDDPDWAPAHDAPVDDA